VEYLIKLFNSKFLHNAKKWRIGLGLFLAVALTSLTFIPGSKKTGYNRNDLLILGHAGSGFLYPIYPFNPYPANSMKSIKKALEDNGADGVEVDVQLTKDGVPVLYHDVTLESKTNAKGLIDDHLATDVVGLKYKGGFFYDIFHRERIITLEQMLQLFSTYSELPFLHIDLRNNKPERHAYYAQTVTSLLSKYNYPLSKLVFISPDPDFLLSFRQIEPKASLVLDIDGELEKSLRIAYQHNFDGICVNSKKITPEQVARVKQKGLQVVLFGGKSHSSIEQMLALGPDAVQVNNLKAIQEMLD
jgi:glycerophosphoryl diester phosphodiesterase